MYAPFDHTCSYLAACEVPTIIIIWRIKCMMFDSIKKKRAIATAIYIYAPTETIKELNIIALSIGHTAVSLSHGNYHQNRLGTS